MKSSSMSWHSRTSSPSQLWHLQTTTLSVAIAFSAWLLVLCSLVWCTKSSYYLLSQSENFNKLVQCIKYKRGLSGHECFLAHKDELLTELQGILTKAGFKYLVRSFDSISDPEEQDGISLSLKVNDCFNKVNAMYKPWDGVQWSIFAGVLMLCAVATMTFARFRQNFILLESVLKNLEVELATESDTRLSEDSIIFDSISSLGSTMQAVKNRLGEIGDVSREICNIKDCNTQLGIAVGKINKCLFGGRVLTAALVAGSPVFVATKEANAQKSGSGDFSNDELCEETPSTTPIILPENGIIQQNKLLITAALDSSRILLTGTKQNDDEYIKSLFKKSVLQRIQSTKLCRTIDTSAANTNKLVPTGELQFKSLNKFDASGKRFKRLLIPGRGWVASKVIESEEKELGPDAKVPMSQHWRSS